MYIVAGWKEGGQVCVQALLSHCPEEGRGRMEEEENTAIFKKEQ
jgi:hypothetical protein